MHFYRFVWLIRPLGRIFGQYGIAHQRNYHKNKCSISLYLMNISRYTLKPNGYIKKGDKPNQKLPMRYILVGIYTMSVYINAVKAATSSIPKPACVLSRIISDTSLAESRRWLFPPCAQRNEQFYTDTHRQKALYPRTP